MEKIIGKIHGKEYASSPGGAISMFLQIEAEVAQEYVLGSW